jgi:CheY-like chemotaxis protein
VTLPLLREMPKTADSASSNTKSITSILRESDESISTLRNRVIGRRVSLHGFDLNTVDPVINKMGQLLKSSVTNFLTNWYGFQVVPLGQETSIIISNEANPETILKLARQAATIHRNNPTIVVLCSHSSRFDRNVSPSDCKYKVGFIAKPVGPLKLAKAIMACLEGTLPLPTPGLQQDGPASIAESNDLSNVFEELSMSRHGTELLDNSRMAVDSDNARKAIESPTPNAQTEKNVEFPFPTVDDRPSASKMHSMPADKESLVSVTGSTKSHPASIVLASMGKAALALPLASPRASARHKPSLLLVDDNQINLSLLATYMERKNYDIVHKAENGLEAVNKFKEREGGYDIVFMDISMPILNGFEATREIRAIERSRRERSSNPLLEESTASFVTANSIKSPSEQSESSKAAALVIAITGLASNRDQTEAAASGVDLFLTKPVRLKDVGKMLENWEANRERDSRGSGSSEA